MPLPFFFLNFYWPCLFFRSFCTTDKCFISTSSVVWNFKNFLSSNWLLAKPSNLAALWREQHRWCKLIGKGAYEAILMINFCYKVGVQNPNRKEQMSLIFVVCPLSICMQTSYALLQLHRIFVRKHAHTRMVITAKAQLQLYVLCCFPNRLDPMLVLPAWHAWFGHFGARCWLVTKLCPQVVQLYSGFHPLVGI